MTDKMSRGLSVKVDVDVSEALTGLKALQREAKKATQALRDLETQLDTSEGSVLYYISTFTNIPIEQLVTKSHAEIAFLFASTQREVSE